MKQYGKRSPFQLDQAGGYYCRHIAAMTEEGLHDKADIAAELAFRDKRIDELLKAARVTVCVYCNARLHEMKDDNATEYARAVLAARKHDLVCPENPFVRSGGFQELTSETEEPIEPGDYEFLKLPTRQTELIERFNEVWITNDDSFIDWECLVEGFTHFRKVVLPSASKRVDTPEG